MATIELFDKATDVRPKTNNPAARKVGGFEIFATTSEKLEGELARLSKLILEVHKNAAGLNASLARYLVEQKIDAKIAPRCFGAALGRQLHLGYLDSVICEGSKGGLFWVHFELGQLSTFNNRVGAVAGKLTDKKRMMISDIRSLYFPAKAKGDWTHAMYIAARLVRIGLAEYEDRFTLRIPEGLSNANLRADKRVAVTYPQWMVPDRQD